MDLRADELIRRIRLPARQAKLAAVLSESGHAPRAGDFEGVLRRRGARRRRTIARRAHRARQRRAHRLRATETEKLLRGERLSPAVLRAGQEMLAREIAPDRRHSLDGALSPARRAKSACRIHRDAVLSRRDAKSSFAADSRHRSSRSHRARQARRHARRRARGGDCTSAAA